MPHLTLSLTLHSPIIRKSLIAQRILSKKHSLSSSIDSLSGKRMRKIKRMMNREYLRVKAVDRLS
jgi:hypothetical protein